MKKFLLILLFLVSFAVSAQLAKGVKILGGNFSICSQNGNGSNSLITNNNFSIGPSFGYFINEKYALIGTINYSNSYYEYTGLKYTLSSFGIGSSLRRYFQISEKFFFALDGYLNFLRVTDKQTTTVSVLQTTQTPYYNISVGFQPNFIFFPSPNLGFSAGLGGLSYGHYQNLSTASSSNFVGLNLNSTLTFGVSYYFTNKK